MQADHLQHAVLFDKWLVVRHAQALRVERNLHLEAGVLPFALFLLNDQALHCSLPGKQALGFSFTAVTV